MATVFSTHNIHPRERVAFWREAMGDVPHEFNAGVNFLGSVRAQLLDSILVSDFRCDPCEVRRTRRNIARATGDEFILCIQLDGRAVYCQDERQCSGDNGSLVLLDPRRPFAVHYQEPAESVRLKIPRAALEARLGNVAEHVCKTMDAGRPLSGLASGFLALLPSRVAELNGAVCVAVADQALDLVALAYATQTDQCRARLSSARATSLLRLKTAIEARLGNPHLKPVIVAAAAGIGVRYANELLSQEGSSIERYILHRRLERCRRALEDPLQAGRMIGEIAFGWGFSDMSHFSRRFRSAYAMSPADYRRRAQERAANGGTES